MSGYKNQIKIGLVLYLFLIGKTISAQTKIYRLEDCIEYAFEKNNYLIISQLDKKLAQQAQHTQRLEQLPNLSVFGNQNWNFGRSIDPTTNEFTTDAVRSNFFQIATTWTLFAGGELRFKNQQKNIQIRSADAQIEAQKNALKLQILEGYITVLYNRELAEVAHFQLENTIDQAQQTDLLIRAGKLPEATAYDLTAQKAEDELHLIEAQKNLTLSILHLRQVMQYTESDSLRLETSNFDNLDQKITWLSLAEFQKNNISNMPQMQAANLAFEYAKLETKIRKAQLKPKIISYANVQSNFSNQATALTFGEIQEIPIGYFYDNSNRKLVYQENQKNRYNPLIFSTQIEQNLRQMLGLSIQFALFEGRESKWAEAKIRHEQAQLNYLTIEHELTQKMQSAYIEAQSMLKAYQVYQTKAQAVENSFRVVLKKFQLGATNALEFALSANKLRMARSELIRAKYHYLLALKTLDFYAGKPLTLD